MNTETTPLPRVLIVDDMASNIRVLSHILNEQAEIFFATSGVDALALAREKMPDLILLDVEMPNMDGYEVCHALKTDLMLAQIPVIFVTGHSGVKNEIRALEAGAVDFITKPLNPPVVSARVKTHLTLKRQSDILRAQANLDGLTGIHNRRSFDEKLDEECRRHRRYGSPMALAMIDVDHFKRFNDDFGHDAGDLVLKSISELLMDRVRVYDLACRYGGEELVLLMPGCQMEDAIVKLEAIRIDVAALQISYQGFMLPPVTVSIGLAETHGGSAEALLRQADEALYRAKRQGRNRLVVQDDGAPPMEEMH